MNDQKRNLDFSTLRCPMCGGIIHEDSRKENTADVQVLMKCNNENCPCTIIMLIPLKNIAYSIDVKVLENELDTLFSKVLYDLEKELGENGIDLPAALNKESFKDFITHKKVSPSNKHKHLSSMPQFLQMLESAIKNGLPPATTPDNYVADLMIECDHTFATHHASYPIIKNAFLEKYPQTSIQF